MAAISPDSIPFNPATDIPSLEGKVILVTGGNNGLGKQSVLEFARHGPAKIWLASRDVKKGQAVADEIKKKVPAAKIQVLQLDLASFDSVKKAATTFSAESERLDILMLNAGIMASAAALTKEGYEMQFGTNHMGHALFTQLLMPVLQKTVKSSETPDVRVVVLSSAAYQARPEGGVGIEFDSLKTVSEGMATIVRYGQSKLANVCFARELARRHPELRVVSVHPGPSRTNLVSSMTGLPLWIRLLERISNYGYTPVDQGVKNQLWASVSTDYTSGDYVEPVGVRGKFNADGIADDLDEKLWDWTEKELRAHVPSA
ncbi:hypothetical protein G7Z17_g4446 [Cylindrodendrum hubeiense]|uniref:Short-chain dehydrogenase/reductase n=1 Tax=Cylindrodendrum hubeiense TaxID=595255 RepID=A0A9P5HCU0_9HYPO|nr:hypothetical protein G7Z17_g4446 [Cylindrodendrum hubeiense]